VGSHAFTPRAVFGVTGPEAREPLCLRLGVRAVKGRRRASIGRPPRGGPRGMALFRLRVRPMLPADPSGRVLPLKLGSPRGESELRLRPTTIRLFQSAPPAGPSPSTLKVHEHPAHSGIRLSATRPCCSVWKVLAGALCGRRLRLGLLRAGAGGRRRSGRPDWRSWRAGAEEE
jgi:hypothetical protein